jgi:hypothetical protein
MMSRSRQASAEDLIGYVEASSAARARRLVLVATVPTLLVLNLIVVFLAVAARAPGPVVVGALLLLNGVILVRILRVSFTSVDGLTRRFLVRNVFRTYRFGGLARGQNVRYRSLRVLGPGSSLFVQTDTGRWVPVLRCIAVAPEDLTKR